eukprot:11221511-Lingulodinium_polyedra.AAC.1
MAQPVVAKVGRSEKKARPPGLRPRSPRWPPWDPQGGACLALAQEPGAPARGPPRAGPRGATVGAR